MGKIGSVQAALEEVFVDRKRARPKKREAVLRTAARLFLDVGYGRATLSMVADALRITKPALYTYFESKEAILVECNRMGFALVNEATARITASKGTGLEKVHALLRAYVRILLEDFGACLVRVDDRELSAEERAAVRKGKRGIDQRVRTWIRAGIADGSIVPCDPKLTAFTIFGALNWAPSWFRPDGPWTADEVADQMAERLVMGLAARSKKTKKKKRGS